MLKFFLSLLQSRKSPPRITRKAPGGAKAASAARDGTDPPAPPPAGPKDPSASSRPGFLDRLPVPEVSESHDESAWDEWEQSSTEIDSRMGGLSASDSVKVNGGTPSQNGELDPFASVRSKKRP